MVRRVRAARHVVDEERLAARGGTHPPREDELLVVARVAARTYQRELALELGEAELADRLLDRVMVLVDGAAYDDSAMAELDGGRATSVDARRRDATRPGRVGCLAGGEAPARNPTNARSDTRLGQS